MRHLLAKDVRLAMPYVWLIVPAHVLFCAQAFLVPELDFWMNLAIALSWTVVVALLDWRFESDRLLASLPVTRATIVRARYASAVAVVALGAVLYTIYGHAVMAVATTRLAERWSREPAWASPDGIAAFLLVGYVLLIAFLPFYFRFGLPLGAALFSATAALTISAATALTHLLAGSEPAAARAALTPSEGIRAWLSSLSAWWGPELASLGILAAAVLAGILSVRLSIRFYEGRDL
jgi:hypothetical protein